MRTLSDGEEGRWVANSIFDNKMNHQLTNDKFCILYRTNAQSRAMEDALRKKRIAYKIYGGTSFYQRKEIKDILSYLRILINPNDEEALKRIINYPARGIGQTTVDKLILAANHYKRPMIDIVNNIDKVDLKINAGTKNKLQGFSEMIKAFGIEAQKMNAFEIAESIVKRVKIVKDLEADGTPEGISKVENVQELLNGIKYFIDDAKEKGQEDSLAVFLEDVALKTDLDSDKPDDEPVVSLMTIHLAKGLEYPYVYIVGLEESLFPSAMSMNTRSELEEERRLFYVALTRAEEQAYLSYANTRYRWGKLTDAEPSRFLEEIDAKYLEYLTPKRLAPRTNNFVDSNLFEDDLPKDRIRYRKPVARSKTSVRNQTPDSPKKSLIKPPSNFKKVSETNNTGNLFDSKITVGNFVEHQRFGKGEVLKMEGTGGDVKAEIRFEKQGVKKLILKFSKLKVIG
jgi:DNA helicase-2/ATP-dependent DNA helicase PcrA